MDFRLKGNKENCAKAWFWGGGTTTGGLPISPTRGLLYILLCQQTVSCQNSFETLPLPQDASSLLSVQSIWFLCSCLAGSACDPAEEKRVKKAPGDFRHQPMRRQHLKPKGPIGSIWWLHIKGGGGGLGEGGPGWPDPEDGEQAASGQKLDPPKCPGAAWASRKEGRKEC